MSNTISRTILLVLIVAVLAFRPAYGGWGEPAETAAPSSSFTPPVNVSNSPDSSQRPRVVRAADGSLHTAWLEGARPAYTKGAGASWQPGEWIVPPGTLAYSNPALAVDAAGTVHVAVAAKQDSPYVILYLTRPITGSWSSPITLSLGLGSSSAPTIAADSQGGVWAAWQTVLSDTNTEVYARYRPAGGDWGALMRVTSNAAQDMDPSLAVDRGDVAHLAWRSNSAGVYDIFYSRGAAGSWTPAENLSNTGFYSVEPDLAADGAGNVFVAWADEIGGLDHFQILFRRWDGSAWQPWTYVSSSPSRALYPALAASDSGNLYAVWTDYRDDLQHPEIYFSHSTDYGATWLGDENVSQTATSSYYPDVAAQPGGYAHVVWEDTSPGQLDIFYSRARAPAFAGEGRGYLPVVRK